MVDILNSLDVLAVQEHWLYKQSLSFLNSVHSDFNSRGITSIDYGESLSGRPVLMVESAFYGGIHSTRTLNR